MSNVDVRFDYPAALWVQYEARESGHGWKMSGVH